MCLAEGWAKCPGWKEPGGKGVCVFAVEWYRVDEHFPGSRRCVSTTYLVFHQGMPRLVVALQPADTH